MFMSWTQRLANEKLPTMHPRLTTTRWTLLQQGRMSNLLHMFQASYSVTRSTSIATSGRVFWLQSTRQHLIKSSPLFRKGLMTYRHSSMLQMLLGHKWRPPMIQHLLPPVLRLSPVHLIASVEIILRLVARTSSMHLLFLRPFPVHRIASVDIVLRLVARIPSLCFLLCLLRCIEYI